MERLRHWLKLLSIPQIGHQTAVKIVKLLGEPGEFKELSQAVKSIDFIPENIKKNLLHDNDLPGWDKTCQLMDELSIKYTTILDKDYPYLLKNIYDPPPIIFYRGSFAPGKLSHNLAVVGTRKPSNYGKLMAKKIAEQLAESGLILVSGLAAGIDTIAHKAALYKNKPTIAVLGTAIDNIYPPVNRNLAEEILQNGCLVSEHAPGLRTDKWTFPARNRIISGLTTGTLVIEGAVKSGALLTAKFALEQNRDLFALPGDVNREVAKGPNKLIKLGAKLVSDASDILEEYDMQMDFFEDILPKLSPEEEKIFDILQSNKPDISLDNLIIKSRLPFSEISQILLSLELKSIIKKMPGNRIVPLF